MLANNLYQSSNWKSNVENDTPFKHGEAGNAVARMVALTQFLKKLQPRASMLKSSLATLRSRYAALH